MLKGNILAKSVSQAVSRLYLGLVVNYIHIKTVFTEDFFTDRFL